MEFCWQSHVEHCVLCHSVVWFLFESLFPISLQYENLEQAKETRQALHGTRWPTSNPKILRVDYASQEEVMDKQE